MEQVEENMKSDNMKFKIFFTIILIISFSFSITYGITLCIISEVERPYADWEASVIKGFEHTTFYDIEFVNDTHGWLVGWGESPNGEAAVLATKDGGLSWEIQLELNWSIRNLSVINSSNIWASSSSSIYHSIDGGESWMKIIIPIAKPSQVEFFNESYGWIGSYDGLAKTIDGGDSWQVIDSWPNHTFPNDFHVTPSNVRIATLGQIYISNDLGETWNIEYEKTTEAMSFINDDIGWAAHPFTVSKFKDDEWIEHPKFSLPLNYYSPVFNDIKFIDENRGWIAGREPAIAYTPDGGLSWYEQEIHRNQLQYESNSCHLLTIDVVNESCCWAAGYDGIVAKTRSGNLLGPKLYRGFYLKSPFTGGRMIPYEPFIPATIVSIILGIIFVYCERRSRLGKD